MAKWTYPALFVDTDPVEIHQKYIEQFQGREMPDKVYVCVSVDGTRRRQ